MMRYVAALCALGIVIALALALYNERVIEIPASELRETSAAGAPERAVSYERTYEDGVHAIEGTVATIDACETARASATLDASGTLRIDISIAPTEGSCLVRPGETAWEASAEAPEEAPLAIYVNGALVVAEPL